MFEVHLHFSESYADWAQVLVAVFGFFFLYKQYQQGNKNLSLQINAQRTLNRPYLTMAETHFDISYMPSDPNFIKVAQFALEISNKDAIDVSIRPIQTEIITFCDLSGKKIPSILRTRVSVGEKFSFYVLKANQSADDFKSAIKRDHMAANMQIHISFHDELGYAYFQEFNCSLGTELSLKPVEYR